MECNNINANRINYLQQQRKLVQDRQPSSLFESLPNGSEMSYVEKMRYLSKQERLARQNCEGPELAGGGGEI